MAELVVPAVGPGVGPHWLALLLPAEPPADWVEGAEGAGAAPPLRFWDLGPVADSAAQVAAPGGGDDGAAAGL